MSYNLNGAIQGGNITLTTGALSGLSGTATTYSTGATAMTTLHDGKFNSVSQVSGGATPTTDGITGAAFNAMAANKACCFVWSVNASDTVHVTQGPIVAYTDTTASSTVVPFPASVPSADAVFAYVVIKNGSTGSSWVFGTGNWDATGITVDTVVNCAVLPATPPLSA